MDEGVAVLQRAVQLSPARGFEKYMYLGQLLDAQPAMLCVRAGLKILQVGMALAARVWVV